MRSLLVFGILAGVMGVFAPYADAYIPPPAFIVNEAMKSHDSLKTLTIDGRVTDLRNQQSLRETLKIDFSNGKMSASYATDLGPEGVYDTQVKDLHRLGKFWLTLGVDPSDSRFKEALQELNMVAGEKTEATLGRVGHTVIWEWGNDPRVGFLEDEFLPALYRTGKAEAAEEEIFIPEYTSSGSAIRIPKLVFIKLQGKDAYRFEVKSTKMNVPLKFLPNQPGLKSAFAKDWVTLVR